MSSIKFSHRYRKMPRKKQAILLQVFLSDYKELSEGYKIYDTLYFVDNRHEFYELPKEKLLVLLLSSDDVIWTTIRRWTPEKERYYRSKMGEVFDIEITGE